ncbi:outer membrane beta-barrel protein [Niabella beijingensis]|uniref:outer membrane beta-barrel protein n=1 Tax=Niabella beijingensis TaxID=2872700 RepID=UPI001CBBD3F9|nr:outer membrane beta-barrel protein [Niabella beijingensis]
MKKIATLVLLLFYTGWAGAQGMVNGKLLDTQTKKGLYLATVTIYKAADTSIVTYRLSAEDGTFKIPGLPLNVPLRAIATFTGYKVMRTDFTLTQAALNMDTLWMSPDSTSLDEVLVVAERPPMTVRKDTIEFNAAAFKTLPNALVEDLLKKLPGVQVDRDGNITVNGKPVNRITVDGKAFFGDDPKMATRNLPSNVIDKVQVTDDKEELLRRGDDNLNNVGKVINLTFKKGVKKGMFGKAYAGAGTEGTYEAGAIANIFRDTLQVSALGYINNLNRPGFSFSELMQTGGMQRNTDVNTNRSVSIWRNSSGGTGIRINDINFGGITEYGGLSTSSGLGLNINHSPSSKQSIFGQYFYGNVKVDVKNDGYTTYNNADTLLRRSEKETAKILINAHNIGLGAKLRPDTLTNILAGINYMAGTTVDDRFTLVQNTNSVLGPLSDGGVDLDRDNVSRNYRHYINYSRLSRTKKGRRLNLNHQLSWQLRDNEATTHSLINYQYPQPKDSLFDQLRNEKVPTLNVSIYGNYSEPVIKNLSVRMDARYEYEQLTNTIRTYARDGSGGFTVLNNALSNRFERTSNSFSTAAGLEYKNKKLTITPRVRYQSQRFVNRLVSLPQDVVQQLNTFLPELGIVYGKLNIDYRKEVILPGYRYLIPVFDNTNPYVINNGNPDLLPAIRHSLQLNMYTYDPKLSLNVWGWARAATIRNDVIQNILQQDNGTQLVLPVNAGEGKSISGNGGINKQNKFSQRFTMNSNIGFYYEYNENYFSYNNQLSKQYRNNVNLWAGIGLNWNDVFEWNNNASYGGQKVRNSNKTLFQSYDVTSYEISSEQILRWPKHIILENNIAFIRNSAFVDPSLREYVRWNAAVNITMFKNEAGVLRLGVNDILKKINNTQVILSQNMLKYSNGNVLGNYYMATFTYNIRPTGAKKKVGGQSLLLF